jgi:hypothetical protein
LVIHFGFDAPEAAAELTQGDEQPEAEHARVARRSHAARQHRDAESVEGPNYLSQSFHGRSDPVT